MAKIRHIAIRTHDPQGLAEFYVNTFGMKITQPLMSIPDHPESGRWVFLTDGYIDMALIAVPENLKGGTKDGINHFGFTMDDGEYSAVLGKLGKLGIAPRKARAGRPYVEDRVHDIHGNPIDLSSKVGPTDRQ
jgi:catechol 2,3-dioxygenase-like lactoylglutathione lyase family enzyme